MNQWLMRPCVQIMVSMSVKLAYETDFDEFRVKFVKTREQIANSISQCIHPSMFIDLKTHLILCFPEQGELENATDVKSVMNVVKIHCTIINIVPMETIADHFNLDEAKSLVKQYKESLDSFCSEVKLTFVLGKDLCPHYQPFVHSEIKFILDWNPVDHKFQDIRRLIEKAFKDMNKRVIVKRISEGSSIIVLCSAPNDLLDALYLEAQKNVTVLIQEFSLVQLKIGSYTVYDKILRGKEMKIMKQQLEQEAKKLQTFKNVNIQKIAGKNKILLEERSVSDSSRLAPMQETDHSENEYVIINSDAFAGKLLKDLLKINAVKLFREQVSHVEKQLEKQLSLPQTNKKDIAELQERFQKDHVEKFEEHCKVVDELMRLSEENEAWQKELNQKIINLTEKVEKLQTASPVMETEAIATTGSVVEPPLPVISDLLLKLDDLASQMIPKEATSKRRSILETQTNEVCTAYNLPPKIDSFDDSDFLHLPRVHSNSSSGIGSTIDHPTLGRDDNKLLNIGEDQNTPAADELLPPHVKLHPKTSNRLGKFMTEKDHNFLEVIWTMSDFTDALKRLLEQEKH
ncbi:PREDICTED: uncharacterized protein LOC109585287 [Amphimedon queenslandica]|uniref:Uncharacterized protein n=1 Tax=Amphimedon queenslandica TaxID=400682 RepID=A0AAN0JJJ8_AMPQE|nr:PREDICTED: uncharacterized protein LOC109585287 [Amphimedon queenslandica]|eukprot:XP_019856848.1 PREDICTED: uncharacterized protein LOC109585287 [Amphimedon queenslandica]